MSFALTREPLQYGMLPECDPEQRVPVFRKDHAQIIRGRRTTVRGTVVMLHDNWRYDGSSHQVRRRSKRPPQGRRRAHSRQGPLYRRSLAGAGAARADAALAACAREIHHQRHQGPRDAGRGIDPDRGRSRPISATCRACSTWRPIRSPARHTRSSPGTRFATSATPSPSSSPIPSTRPAMRSRRSK